MTVNLQVALMKIRVRHLKQRADRVLNNVRMIATDGGDDKCSRLKVGILFLLLSYMTGVWS